MTVAYWCVFITALMPYVWAGMAKASKPKYNNYKPRVFLNDLDGWGQRANWAQANSFEAFPAFAAAVIIASQIAIINPGTLDKLAILFVIARILYGIFYLTNHAPLRSLAWLVGIGSWMSIFILSF
jgi:uncharacterized MAPEG superfamily protein